MVVNGSKKNAEKCPEIYKCSLCDFECSKKSNFDIHLRTAKHRRITLDNKKCQKNAEIFFLIHSSKFSKLINDKDTNIFREKPQGL